MESGVWTFSSEWDRVFKLLSQTQVGGGAEDYKLSQHLPENIKVFKTM